MNWARNLMKRMRDSSHRGTPDPDALDVPTLFPYKITDEGLLVHVDVRFFRDLQERLEMTGDDYIRIEASSEGIEITPISLGHKMGGMAPYRVRLEERGPQLDAP